MKGEMKVKRVGEQGKERMGDLWRMTRKRKQRCDKCRLTRQDIHRIWKRNLGRDDRVISDLGKEARHPFLDEDFVKFISTVPLHYISDYREERGTGDKKILRMVSGLL